MNAIISAVSPSSSPSTKERQANHEDKLYDVIEQLKDEVKEKDEKIGELEKKLEDLTAAQMLPSLSDTPDISENEVRERRKNSMSDEDFIGVEDLSTAYAMIQQSHGYYVRCSWTLSILLVILLTFSYYHFVIDYYPCFLDEYKITS